jgi:glycerate 2-kinase
VGDAEAYRRVTLSDTAHDALDIFLQALDATRVAAAMERRLTCTAGVMVVDGHGYVLSDYRKLMLVSIGKAAGTMTNAFLHIVRDNAARMQGVIAGVCEEQLPEHLQIFAGGHPGPNQDSLDAAAAILRLLEQADERDLVVFLVSGGGSSMVEQMLRGDISLEDTAATHKALVESGAPIAAINAVRKHLSAVKGGRLAAAAAPAQQLTIFVSDVPIGELDALASGPTLPDRSTVADVRRIVAEYQLTARVPPAVADLLGSQMAETPKPGGAIFAKSQWTVLLDSASLEEAASSRAADLGWNVTIDNTCDDWDAEDAAKYLVQRLVELRRRRHRVCLLSAGEVTVRVPASASGHGGRNQHFALMCSQQIAGSDFVVLSAGSDGVDGNSSAAGAIANATTVARAAAADYPVERALAGFDSHALLSMLGDAIVTGPTGNNLRDLRILLAP